MYTKEQIEAGNVKLLDLQHEVECHHLPPFKREFMLKHYALNDDEFYEFVNCPLDDLAEHIGKLVETRRQYAQVMAQYGEFQGEFVPDKVDDNG